LTFAFESRVGGKGTVKSLTVENCESGVIGDAGVDAMVFMVVEVGGENEIGNELTDFNPAPRKRELDASFDVPKTSSSPFS